MTQTPRFRLTWFLIKKSVDTDDLDQIIEPPTTGSIHPFRVPVLDGDRDSLFVKASVPHPPKWLRYVSGHIGSAELPGMLGGAASGVLLVRSGTRMLALTFGYGRFLLRSESVEQDFGLRVVLNSVDPAQIKSVDARTFDELTVHTRRGVSRDSRLSVFELDVTRNLLRGLTGTAHADGLEGGLTGADSLAMMSAVQLPGLPALATTLLKASRATRYRKHFGFIDDMKAERDKTMIQRLDHVLVTSIRDRELDAIHLAVPEAIDWQDVAGVRFSFRARDQELQSDPRISIYRDLRGANDISVARLKSDKVEAMDAADDTVTRRRWSVYNCIVCETEVGDKVYVLSGGDWYSVKKSYRDKVVAFALTLPTLTSGMPLAVASEAEDEYNRRAASAIGGLNMDRALVSLDGPDRVELCDILTRDGIFIHVKKRGRSSTLSHLFAQGVTATELMLEDDVFLKDATRLVESLDPTFAKAIPSRTGAREQIRVAYVILSRSRRTTPFGLPFFSLVSLQAAAHRLKAAGVEVFVQDIKEVPVP
jgi:uncharacterized protein (TIGR04141 family)